MQNELNTTETSTTNSTTKEAPKKKKGFLSRWYTQVIIGIIIGGIMFGGGDTNAVSLEEKDTVIEQLEEELDSVTAERDELAAKAEEIMAMQDELEADLAAIEEEQAAITAAQEEEKAKAAAKPVTLGAGTFFVGDDIAAGRYVVSTQDRGGNFFVNGSTYVNEILGTGAHAINNVTINLEDGDEVQIMGLQSVSFKLK
jgi:hypothetical protein